MYVEMIETRSLRILLKSFHENYSDLLKKQRWNEIKNYKDWNSPAYRLCFTFTSFFCHARLPAELPRILGWKMDQYLGLAWISFIFLELTSSN